MSGKWDPKWGRAYRERQRLGEASGYIATLSWEDRLERKIQRSATGCWEWTGGKDPRGYGIAHLPKGKTTTAHRDVYQHLVGPIPEGLTLDHLCRNRACVNPAHLEPVTLLENVRRGWAARRAAS